MHRSVLAPAALAALSLLVGSVPAASAVGAPSSSEAPEVVVVLDSSGSMAEADAGGGQTRMDAAKQAVTELARSTPEGTRLGLRTYGDGVDSEAPGSCEDTTLRVPVGPVDADAVAAEVADLAPRGDTPIGTALLAAAEDFTGDAAQTVVLVSDGEPTCDPDPCPVAADLAARGIDLRIDVVGFRVDAEAREVLQCVADAGGGTYVDAADAAELSAALDTSALRGFRVYRPEGTPVEGALEATGAPLVEEGQYLDEIRSDEPRYYTVEVPRGWTVRAGATITRGDDPQRRGVRGMLVTSVLAPGEEPQCASSIDFPDNARGSAPLSGGVLSGPDALRVQAPETCLAGGPLLVRVEWTGTDQPVALPMELVISLEPPVRGSEGLGEAGDRTTVFPEPPAVPDPVAVDGGPSFNDATELRPGAWSDSMRRGETVYYRVRVGWGQQLALRVDFPRQPPDSALRDSLRAGTYANVLVFDENRLPAFPEGTRSKRYTEFRDGEAQDMYITTHAVTWANRRELDLYAVRNVSRAGDYLVMLSLDGDSSSVEDEGLAIPFTLGVDLLGEAEQGPQYVTDGAAVPASDPAAPSPAASEEAATAPSTGASPEAVATADDVAPASGRALPAVVVVLVGLAVLLVAVLAALVLWGLRRRAGPDGPADPGP
ncbi:VWA domain-containing protein [Aquipuribacter sp. SD81]|uniref:VWA domain-containing protein n=1 Tax=Aquipuribacter sp. SD81 TaxID=3127703 RepID=UPI003018AB79